jgi:hypothetical protein
MQEHGCAHAGRRTLRRSDLALPELQHIYDLGDQPTREWQRTPKATFDSGQDTRSPAVENGWMVDLAQACPFVGGLRHDVVLSVPLGALPRFM